MLKILEAECKRLEIPTFMLTGETKDRMQMVNNFQNATQPCVFLLSLRAAGTGLNLQMQVMLYYTTRGGIQR
jgi:SNF2 family DNA or RNA helicase